MVAPVEEVAHGVGVDLAGVGVGDLAVEELVPSELGPAARGGDDDRQRTGRAGTSAATPRSPVAPRAHDDLGRITHFRWVPCPGPYDRQGTLSSATVDLILMYRTVYVIVIVYI